MTIKKITNIKYSQSKNQTEAIWFGALAKRNQLLVETDWTQLPDVKLNEICRNQWMSWRESLRGVRRNKFKSSTDMVTEIDRLDRARYSIPVEYSTVNTIKDLETGKRYLHKLLVSFYDERLNHSFLPNLENKYQEALDIISIYLSQIESEMEVDSFNMSQLVEYIKKSPEIKIDIALFPFFEITQRIKNYNINDTIIYILDQKQKQFNFSLQEEYNMLHYEHRIEFCSDIDDILEAKREIEMHYGY